MLSTKCKYVMQKKAMLNSICIPVSAWQALLKHSSEWRSVAPHPDNTLSVHVRFDICGIVLIDCLSSALQKQ